VILTDREIRIAIEQGLIAIEPAPGPEALSSTSLDLSLDPRAQTFSDQVGSEINIDPAGLGFSFSAVVTRLTDPISIEPQFALAPRKLLLAWTREKVGLPLPSRLAARVEGKSSLARLGLGVHITAPTIHAGFSGKIQLEIVNQGPAEVILRPGMRICQLIFETTLGTPEKGYSGIFLAQGTD